MELKIQVLVSLAIGVLTIVLSYLKQKVSSCGCGHNCSCNKSNIKTGVISAISAFIVLLMTTYFVTTDKIDTPVIYTGTPEF